MAYLDQVKRTGGSKGRQKKLIVADDQIDPEAAVSCKFRGRSAV